jgi:hypothetical protein
VLQTMYGMVSDSCSIFLDMFCGLIMQEKFGKNLNKEKNKTEMIKIKFAC